MKIIFFFFSHQEKRLLKKINLWEYVKMPFLIAEFSTTCQMCLEYYMLMIFKIYFMYYYSSRRKEYEHWICLSLVFWIPIHDQPFQNISTLSLQRRINHHHQIGQAYVWLFSVSHFNDVQKTKNTLYHLKNQIER